MSVCIPRFADAHISQNVSYRGDVQVVFETGTFDQGPVDIEDYGDHCSRSHDVRMMPRPREMFINSA